MKSNIAGLQFDFIDHLKRLWSDTNTDWSGYDSWLNETYKNEVEVNYARATKYKAQRTETLDTKYKAQKIEKWDVIKFAGLENYAIRGKKYYSNLPEELEKFYVYTSDGGHSIVVILENGFKEGESIEDNCVPAPVKTVLKSGWKIKDARAASA